MTTSRSHARWSLLLFSALCASAADTYTVSGTVVNRLTGKPLSKARVFLQGASNDPFVTGDNGQFRFDGVKPGKYALAAERLGFERQYYRQRSLGTPFSTAIVTGEGQSTSNLTFGLIPGAVISGSVKDTRGEPIAGLFVSALRVVGLGTERRTEQVASVSTDDRGQYRLHSLAAGNYLVTISGRPRVEPVSTTPMIYPVTYFPGTTTATQARVLRIEAGKETRGDLVLEAVPTVRVTGTVNIPNRAGELYVTVISPGPFETELGVGTNVRVTGDRFAIDTLAAGHYVARLWNRQDRLVGTKAFDATSTGAEITLGETPYPRLEAKVEIRGTPRRAGVPTALQLQHVNRTIHTGSNFDTEGRATIDAIPPGEYEVIVTQDDLLPVISMAVSGGSLTGGLLHVPDTGTVSLNIVADASAAQNVAGLVHRGEQPEGGLLVMLAPAKNWENITSYRFDQSDSDGTFTWLAVPPGDYLAFAFTDGEPQDYADATVMRRLAEQGQTVTITDDPKQVVRIIAR